MQKSNFPSLKFKKLNPFFKRSIHLTPIPGKHPVKMSAIEAMKNIESNTRIFGIRNLSLQRS